jgi:hypothetical protein
MSLLVFLHEIPAIGSVEPVASLVGTEDEGMLIVVEGIGELLLAYTALGAGGKDFMHIGIQLDGLVEITFRSGIIVKLQLAESTIIPGFIQIRLSRQDIVKMLNSNHIVMIAIGDATRDNQPVGIVLGRRGDGEEEEEEKDPPPTPPEGKDPPPTPPEGKDPPPTPPVKGGEQYAKEFVVFLHFKSILLPSLHGRG